MYYRDFLQLHGNYWFAFKKYLQTQKQLYNHKCLSVRSSVTKTSQTAKITFITTNLHHHPHHHPSSFNSMTFKLFSLFLWNHEIFLTYPIFSFCVIVHSRPETRVNWVNICEESSGNKCCAPDNEGIKLNLSKQIWFILQFFCRNGKQYQ